MEWREQSSLSCDEAYLEAQRWIEAVTKKTFGSNDFRSALENGILLCDVINRIKPGTIKRVNRLPTPIAGLDNLNVFLRACGKLGLKEAQLFHPGDLQDLSTRVTVKDQETSRRLKNVLITIYWLGRRAQCDQSYDGPYLNFKAFEGLLGTALYKALHETSSLQDSSIRDSGFGDSWYAEREDLHHLRGGQAEGGEGGGVHKRDNSLDSLNSLSSQAHSISSDTTIKGSSEGCGSDTEADSVFKMTDNTQNISYRRSVSITPKASTPFNQFLPTKDKSSGYVPAPLRKKRAERNEDSRHSWASASNEDDHTLTSSEAGLPSKSCSSTQPSQSATPTPQHQWTLEDDSGSDSDADRPDPDLVLDDLASRRFHSPSPATPTNFAVPASPGGMGNASGVKGGPWAKVTMTPSVPLQNVTYHSSGETQPPKCGSVKVDHLKNVCTDSLFKEVYDDSEDEDDEVGYADPIQDDLYARKMGLRSQPFGNDCHDQFLPKLWTPEEDFHIQKIKLGSQRRPWYKKIQGFRDKMLGSSDDTDCDVSPWFSSVPSPAGTSPAHTHDAAAHTTLIVGKREWQLQESIDGSKSTNDIQLDSAVKRYEQLQKYREQIKESDSKWQDDLSKWKNRRRSVNSDIVKKKEEREKIEQITSGDNYNRRSKTFREMQDERESKGRLSSLSYLEEDVFDQSVDSPQPRKFPARSHTIDDPYHSFETHNPSLKEDEPAVASTATDRAAYSPTSQEVDIVDSPVGRDKVTSTTTRHSSFHSSQSTAVAPLRSSLGSAHSETVKTEMTTTAASSFSSVQKVPEPIRPLLRTKVEVEGPSSAAQSKHQPQLSSMESNPPALSRVSASLPRSYQRSDGARLTSVVAPRPFGTQPSRITSLPRAFTVDDSQKRVNGDADGSKMSAVPRRYQQFVTSEDEADSSSGHSSDEEEEEEVQKDRTTVKSTSMSAVPPPVKAEAPVSPASLKESVKENHCEMRISLNQKPNSSRDFGFQAVWDSTGARVTSIQAGSQAEMCQLQPGDEVLTVNRQQVAEMSYTDWKSCMEEALQEGSLVMDIRRHGKDNWDRDQPSLPFKSHKTINLTSTDHPILLGSSDKSPVNSSLNFTSRVSTDTLGSKESPTRTVIDVASSGVNGGFREPLSMRNKEPQSISLKNLKRRSEFFETGGPEAMMPDILVPPIIPPASRWSWDPEEERRRQEKWQKEQERLLQEKYKRDQEKLQAEWLKAQQEIAKNTEQQEPRILEVNSQSVSISPRAPVSPLKQPNSHPWEEEERKRKEEQERQRQAEEKRRREEEEERERQQLQEERRRREEEEERERQQLQEERRRREEEEEQERQQLQEERRRREEEEQRMQQQLQAERKRKEEEEEERRRLEEEELRWQKRRDQEREDERRRQEAAEQLRRERERALEQQQQQQQQQWHGSSFGFSNIQPSLSFTDRMKSKSTPQLDQEEKTPWKGVNVKQALWLPDRPLRSGHDTQAQSQWAASELDLRRRYFLDSIRLRELERVNSRAVGDGGGQQPLSQANIERQQILNEMKKKTPLLTDSSWIRQPSSSTANTVKQTDLPPMRRGESLDNLDASSSWRSSWTPRSNSYIPNYNQPPSAFSGSIVNYGGGLGVQRPSTLPLSYSVGHLQGRAGTPSSLSSQQSSLPSPLSPTRSPEPRNNAGDSLQRNRSVSGKKICTFCDNPLGKGAAMIIESLGLCYHLSCFKCFDCEADLGGSEAGAEVRIRNKRLYCNFCYMRFKAATPTAM